MPKTIKKVVRKVHKEGEMGETVADLREKLKEKQRTLVYSLLAFGTVIIVAVGFIIYTKVTETKAEALEYEGYRLFNGEAQAPSASTEERYKSALETFKKSYATRKSPISLLYIADSYFALGNYDEAVKTLKDFTSRYSDPHVAALGYYKLAMVYEKKGDKDNALKTFNILAGLKDSPLQDMALLESGSLLESMGKIDEAKKKYLDLTTRFPKSPAAAGVKAKLGK